MPDRKKRKADAEIDRNLRRAFDDLADQPLPARFTDLLTRLKDADRQVEPGSEAPDPDEE